MSAGLFIIKSLQQLNKSTSKFIQLLAKIKNNSFDTL